MIAPGAATGLLLLLSGSIAWLLPAGPASRLLGLRVWLLGLQRLLLLLLLRLASRPLVRRSLRGFMACGGVHRLCPRRMLP